MTGGGRRGGGVPPAGRCSRRDQNVRPGGRPTASFWSASVDLQPRLVRLYGESLEGSALKPGRSRGSRSTLIPTSPSALAQGDCVGELLFISGQVAIDGNGQLVGVGN